MFIHLAVYLGSLQAVHRSSFPMADVLARTVFDSRKTILAALVVLRDVP